MGIIKKLFPLVLCLLLLFSLSACAEEKSMEPYTKSYAFQTFVVDPQACTISGLGHTYHYEIIGDTKEYKITITYPNGSTYSYSKWRGSKSTDKSTDYGNYRYMKGEDLLKMIEGEIPQHPEEKRLSLWALVLITVGMITAFVPQLSWWMTVGLFRKDKEPTRKTLIVYHFCGLAAIIAGIVGSILS